MSETQSVRPTLTLQQITETRASRQRLWDWHSGEASAYQTPTFVDGRVSTPIFNHDLFRHDIHVALFTGNEAIGTVKQLLAVTTPENDTPELRTPEKGEKE